MQNKNGDHELQPGSLVWARLQGYPSWPAMVENDPDQERFYNQQERTNGVQYHVTFFGKKVSRAWVSQRNIQPFIFGEGFPYLRGKNKKLKQSLADAFADANSALSLSLLERFKVSGFESRYMKPPEIRLDSDDDDEVNKIEDVIQLNNSDLDESNEMLMKEKLKCVGKKLLNNGLKGKKPPHPVFKRGNRKNKQSYKEKSRSSGRYTAVSTAKRKPGKITPKTETERCTKTTTYFKRNASVGKRNARSKGKLKGKNNTSTRKKTKIKQVKMTSAERHDSISEENNEDENSSRDGEIENKTRQLKTISLKSYYPTSEESVEGKETNQSNGTQCKTNQPKISSKKGHDSTSEKSAEGRDISVDETQLKTKWSKISFMKRWDSTSEWSVPDEDTSECDENQYEIKQSKMSSAKSRSLTLKRQFSRIPEGRKQRIKLSKITSAKRRDSTSEESAGSEDVYRGKMEQSKMSPMEECDKTSDESVDDEDVSQGGEIQHEMKWSSMSFAKRWDLTTQKRAKGKDASQNKESQLIKKRSQMSFTKKHSPTLRGQLLQVQRKQQKTKQSKIIAAKRHDLTSKDSVNDASRAVHSSLETWVKRKQNSLKNGMVPKGMFKGSSVSQTHANSDNGSKVTGAEKIYKDCYSTNALCDSDDIVIVEEIPLIDID